MNYFKFYWRENNNCNFIAYVKYSTLSIWLYERLLELNQFSIWPFRLFKKLNAVQTFFTEAIRNNDVIMKKYLKFTIRYSKSLHQCWYYLSRLTCILKI